MGGGRISSDLNGKSPAPLKVMTAWASGSPTQTSQLESGNTLVLPSRTQLEGESDRMGRA